MVEQGWHEATLPQLLAAIRAVLAEVQSVDAAALPVPLAPPSQGIESLSSIAPHLLLLQACCDRIGKGLPVDPGVAVPINQGVDQVPGPMARVERPPAADSA